MDAKQRTLEEFEFESTLKKQYDGEYSLYREKSSGAHFFVRVLIPSLAKVQAVAPSPRPGVAKPGTEEEQTKNEREILELLCGTPLFYSCFIIENIPDNRVYLFTRFNASGATMNWVNQYQRYMTQFGGEYNERKAKIICRDVVESLMLLHSKSICHCSIRPDHVYWSDGKYKLFSFKLAHVMKGEVQKVQKVGFTTTFTPPEAIAGESYNGFLGDLYQLGVTLYTLVCGAIPFCKSDSRELNIAIRTAKPALPKYASRNFRSLVESLMEKDPNKRLPLADVLKHTWFQKRVPNKTKKRTKTWRWTFIYFAVHWYTIVKRRRDFRYKFKEDEASIKIHESRNVIEKPHLEGKMRILRAHECISCVERYRQVYFYFQRGGFVFQYVGTNTTVRIDFEDIRDIHVLPPINLGRVRVVTQDTEYFFKATPNLAITIGNTFVALKSLGDSN